jgi:hypothetical protein
MTQQRKVSAERAERRKAYETTRAVAQSIKRRFLGKVDGFKDAGERAFEQKHLKAYLRGDQFYWYGFDTTLKGHPQVERRVFQEVKQQYYYQQP